MEVNLARCDNKERWEGGRVVQEEGYTCILTDDSRCCMAETNTTLITTLNVNELNALAKRLRLVEWIQK